MMDNDEALIYMMIRSFIGMLFSVALWSVDGIVAGSDEVVIETDGQLPHAREFCQEQGFDWGAYSGSTGTEGDTIAISCYPEEDGFWTTYYFDLNMTQVGKEVTEKR